MATRTEVGTATVRVDWNLDANEPEIRIDLEIAEGGIGVDASLVALAAASRRMAAEIETKRLELRNNPPTPANDEDEDEAQS